MIPGPVQVRVPPVGVGPLGPATPTPCTGQAPVEGPVPAACITAPAAGPPPPVHASSFAFQREGDKPGPGMRPMEVGRARIGVSRGSSSDTYTSLYRGVCSERGKWRAQITFGGRKHFLGTYDDETEAARAYDRAALLHHGAKAITNFVYGPNGADGLDVSLAVPTACGVGSAVAAGSTSPTPAPASSSLDAILVQAGTSAAPCPVAPDAPTATTSPHLFAAVSLAELGTGGVAPTSTLASSQQLPCTKAMRNSQDTSLPYSDRLNHLFGTPLIKSGGRLPYKSTLKSEAGGAAAGPATVATVLTRDTASPSDGGSQPSARPSRMSSRPSKRVEYSDDSDDGSLGLLQERVDTYTSKYRGVSSWQGKWRAYICFKGKNHFLGRYDTQEEAALAYDRAAVELHGEKAKTNFGMNNSGLAKKYSPKRRLCSTDALESIKACGGMEYSPRDMGAMAMSAPAMTMAPTAMQPLMVMMTPSGPVIMSSKAWGAPAPGQPCQWVAVAPSPFGGVFPQTAMSVMPDMTYMPMPMSAAPQMGMSAMGADAGAAAAATS